VPGKETTLFQMGNYKLRPKSGNSMLRRDSGSNKQTSKIDIDPRVTLMHGRTGVDEDSSLKGRWTNGVLQVDSHIPYPIKCIYLDVSHRIDHMEKFILWTSPKVMRSRLCRLPSHNEPSCNHISNRRHGCQRCGRVFRISR